MVSQLFFLLESHAVSLQPAPLVSPHLYAFLTLCGDQFTPPFRKDNAYNSGSKRMRQKKTVPGQPLKKSQLLDTQEDRILSV